ncbi:low molecular weight protein-tyrosine-phosphatase [Rubritalea tangerina]|uniref:Low molecular weight protein-tyrosine-phosphatase n=1 Tax=Rubritalea tangerina TaxID=430798 RepID=A0ABW4Z605_9BACT
MKILFVCLGNICRSPAGENVLRHILTQQHLTDRCSIDSAGTAAWHTGKGPDARMTTTLQKRGIPVTGKARQITPADLESFDLILTMDDENYHNVLKLKPSDAQRQKIQKFTCYCQHHSQSEVPDPYYGGQDGFDLVVDMLEDGCQELIQRFLTSRD